MVAEQEQEPRSYTPVHEVGVGTQGMAAQGKDGLSALLDVANAKDARAALELLFKAGVEGLDDFPPPERLRGFLKECGLTLVNTDRIEATVTAVRAGTIAVRCFLKRMSSPACLLAFLSHAPSSLCQSRP